MTRWFWCKHCKKKRKHVLWEALYDDYGLCDYCGTKRLVGDWFA